MIKKCNLVPNLAEYHQTNFYWHNNIGNGNIFIRVIWKKNYPILEYELVSAMSHGQ